MPSFLSSRRECLSLIAASIAGFASGCGTFLYPERLGQPRSGPIDWKIVALDGIGLVLFVVPGAIAFAVDWYTGTLFLPEYSYGSQHPLEPEIVSIPLHRDQLTRQGIEQAIQQRTGRTVSLEPGTYRAQQLNGIDEFSRAVEQLRVEDWPGEGGLAEAT